ncbi:hypothetical protein J1N35_034649 [Gossypium stocksii]|uniref:Uncharacterized protein n=1 Tax=Gossypium stocksii TaxID=47602 RepID=A0A9D3UUC3_9ROSI|nr:hypothetical protein J1N35_034649 [Gossypium stocksii]
MSPNVHIYAVQMFDGEQNTLGEDFGEEASDSYDSSNKAYESDASYSNSFESNRDRLNKPKVELDLNNDMDSDEDGNKKYSLFNPQIDMRNSILIKVAFVVVKSENKQFLFWFLELLQKDLEIDNSYNGLIKAIYVLFLNVEVRNCDSHIYSNFKNMEGFRGQAMRLTYWKAAKATFPRQFEEAMSEMSIWPLYAGNEKYEVDCGLGKKHVVNLFNSS